MISRKLKNKNEMSFENFDLGIKKGKIAFHKDISSYSF